MLLNKLINKYKNSESFFSFVLGLIIFLIVGNQVVGFVTKKDRTSTVLPGTSEYSDTTNIIADNQTTATKNVYVVIKGDYLYKIAAEQLGNGNRWPEIASLNKIVTPGLIEVGTKLILPAQLANQQALNNNIEKPISDDKYIVQSGDSLWKVCVRAYGDGYQWVKVAKANNLTNPDYIEKGQILALPR